MANEQNLKRDAHRLTPEEASRGGKKSAKVRREKRKLREIANELLGSNVSDLPTAKKIAESLGASNDISFKELAVLAILANTLLKGDVNDLEVLEKFIGEEQETTEEAATSIEIIVEDASRDE
jgi:hypothetical protein